jgi:predicted RNA-binding Zn-ribbon protein involved in translation (DUF1610 family)
VEKPFGRLQKMKATIIIKCTKCGGLILAAKEQKTKICPYCGVNIDLSRAQRVASASNPFEASKMLRKLKSEQGFTSKT